MNFVKEFVKKYFKHFSYFYSHLRYRMLLGLVLSLLVGTLDGLGLAMFLPLLQLVDGQTSADSMGNLRFLVDGMLQLGIPLTLISVLLVMLFFFLLKGVARFFETWYKVIVQRYFIKRLRFANVDALNQYSYKAFVMADAGRIQNTLTGEIGRIAGAYRSYFMSVQTMVMVLIYLFLALLANPQFALLVIAGGVLSNLIYRQIYAKTKAASKQLTVRGNDFQGLIIQKVAFFKYLKATALITPYSKKLKHTILKIEEINKRMGFYSAVLNSTREPIVVTVVVCVILIHITYFSQSLGLIILSLLFFYRSLNFLMNLQTNWNGFLSNSGSLESMTEFMKELKEGRERTGKEKIIKFNSELVLKNVSFSYGTQLVLQDINIHICKNQTIAFVGESGSGKTTLVNIIAGLMPVNTGEFLIDGRNARTIDISSYQQLIGYITQEPIIFDDTIFNNVTFWAEKSPETINRFWESLNKASIEEFVKTLSQKEESRLGNNGILLSGGQKQRISIARELYKKADILILDEATSALDSETERAIQQNIDALKGQYTILIVAHRLSTIKNADKVVLIHKGKIVSTGSFNELKKESALFEKMIELQEI